MKIPKNLGILALLALGGWLILSKGKAQTEDQGIPEYYSDKPWLPVIEGLPAGTPTINITGTPQVQVDGWGKPLPLGPTAYGVWRIHNGELEEWIPYGPWDGV